MPLTSFEIADLNKIAELEKQLKEVVAERDALKALVEKYDATWDRYSEKEILAKRLARAIEFLERIELVPPGFLKRWIANR